jgi:hypothetical protein
LLCLKYQLTAEHIAFVAKHCAIYTILPASIYELSPHKQSIACYSHQYHLFAWANKQMPVGIAGILSSAIGVRMK